MSACAATAPLTHEQRKILSAVKYRWTLNARPSQLEPQGDYKIWLMMTGRGWGKNRTAGETVRHWVETGQARRLHLVARTAADARDTMVEGESGLLRICPPWNMPKYEPSKRRLTWRNGAQAILFSADEPNALRGPQCQCWWADELASWKYVQETWDNLQFGARLGHDVRGIITTTPRPIKMLKDIAARPGTRLTRGDTYENRSNLADSFIAALRDTYEGTRLGRQEIHGELIDDNPAALWKRAWIDADRVSVAPEMQRIVVAVDPTCTETGDEAGIVVCGRGVNGEFYCLEDATRHATPAAWAHAAAACYHRWKADRLVYETNQGGEMVTFTLCTVDASIPLRGVHASRGKIVRAEPIAALAEQHRIHHVGAFPELEDELCNYDGTGKSPNRLDAYVYAITELQTRTLKTIQVR